METVRHSLMDNHVQVYRRPNTPHWQCSCSIGGKQRRATTKEESLAKAKDVARDWYLGLMGKYRAGDLNNGVTFRKASDQFLREYEVITEGERNAEYVKSHGLRLNAHLLPYFADKVVTDITPGMVQEYRLHRMTSKKNKKGEVMRPARTTLNHEIVTLRHVLKTANRHGWLPFLPDLTAPYKSSGKIKHRAWFSPDEYETLYKHTRDRIDTASKATNERWPHAARDFHDYILFMVNTGLRPDEAGRFQVRDVNFAKDEVSGKNILEIAVRGKRGVGWCKSMPGAVQPFKRMVARHKLQPTDTVFRTRQRDVLNVVLDELSMRKDREGNRRTSYSLRHTYISMRLMDGADIYQVAKNCRTSVEMIEKYYASHIKDMIDTSAINVRKQKPVVKQVTKPPKRTRK
jgi:integrase